MTDKNPADLAGWESAETCTWRERQWLDYRGGVQCTCDTYPETTSGPEEDCEIHGHPYEEWVKRAAEAEAELARAEIVKPGHVQVRVDDLADRLITHWADDNEDRYLSTFAATRLAIRAVKAIQAQHDQATRPAIPDEPTEPGSRWRLDGKRCVRDASPKGSTSWLDVDSPYGSWLSWGGATSHVEGRGE